jgi:glycosyltransferase involved in cell wall biosynthesis
MRVRNTGSTLQNLARNLGVEASVIFRNRFVSPQELVELIGAADIYITPYKHEGQVVSGTLAYALSAGKAIISTPYLHATELLAKSAECSCPLMTLKLSPRKR